MHGWASKIGFLNLGANAQRKGIEDRKKFGICGRLQLKCEASNMHLLVQNNFIILGKFVHLSQIDDFPPRIGGMNHNFFDVYVYHWRQCFRQSKPIILAKKLYSQLELFNFELDVVQNPLSEALLLFGLQSNISEVQNSHNELKAI